MPNFWFKFEWDAWRNDRQLRRCSKETRGFWIDCIAAMEEQGTFFLQGTPEEICREVVADRGEFDRSIAELSRHGAATIEKSQGSVKIISRRLLKKISITEYNRLKQRERRASDESNECQETPSLKEIEIKNLRALDSSATAEEINEQTPAAQKNEPKTILPIDYRPPAEFWQWAAKDCPDLNLEDELDEFLTFWRDIATKNNKRTLRGWNATWKKRMRELQKKCELTRTSRNGTNGNYRVQREQQVIEERNAIDSVRARVQQRDSGLSGADAARRR